jgi:Fur family ferric uptake transcriptional regulator
MCHRCDYTRLLEAAGLKKTPNRLSVLEVIGNNSSPLNVQEVFDTLNRKMNINRVTVYRIIDLLVKSGILERLSGGGRSFYYGLAPNEHHRPHPHFYCRYCGNMECLNPASLSVDTRPLERTYAGVIQNVEIRVDGVCENCLEKTGRMSDSGNVILIGMPGVGKTTVGRLLAERLGYAFLDTDNTIQTREGRRLQEIIDTDGLAVFGRIEERAILTVSVEAHVIATGGSAVCSEKAMRHLKSGAVVCHLDADPKCLQARIDNMDSRGIAMAPDQSLAVLYAERRRLYLKYADVSIDCSDLSPNKVVQRILDILQSRFHYLL